MKRYRKLTYNIFMQKILIINDDEALTNAIQTKLQINGYTAIAAYNGAEGLEKVESERPNLILLDMTMPKKNGFEVLEALRTNNELKTIPVIIISNSGEVIEIEKAKILGVKDYLIEADFSPDDVLNKIQNVLGPGDAKKKTEESNGIKILLVEDEHFLRDILAQKLSDVGYKVIQAIDGESALRLIGDEKPDLILLDLILPGIDGFTVLEQKSKEPDLANIPVIILSNLGQKEEIDRGLALGAKDFIIKAHFTPGEIVDKIKSFVGK